MRVSIALTTFNGAAFLEQQLESYVTQTRIPDELVVCDDGSIDGTMEILERFRQNAPFSVEVIRNQQNLGFTKNFEKAISLCSGDIIFFSDQDDVWYPDKISSILQCFDAHPGVMLVVHDGELVDERLVFHGATKIRQLTAGFGTTDALVVGALSATRKTFLPYGMPIPEGVVGHDVWLHLLAQLLGVRYVHECCLQKIRRHGSNTSSWIASSVEPISQGDVWLSHMRTQAATDYSDRLRLNSAASERLALALATGSPFLRESAARSLMLVAEERAVLVARQELVQAGFWSRKTRALRLLVRGDYRHFNGFGSFLRDIIR